MTKFLKVALIICCALGIACIGKGVTAEENIELLAKPDVIEIEEEIFYPETLKDWELPEQYWKEDNYSDFVTWWEDFKAIKAEYADIANPAIEEWGEYLSDEDEARLQEIESEINLSHTITEIDSLKEEFDSIIEDSKPAPKPVVSTGSGNYSGSYTGSTYDFKWMGVIYANGWRYTWYSQNVLPGGGLNIPGRHVGEGNLIYDGDGYIVVAANFNDGLYYGDTVPTPFGTGKVYDTGCSQGTIDIYTNF